MSKCKCGEEKTIEKWEQTKIYLVKWVVCPKKRWWNFWLHD